MRERSVMTAVPHVCQPGFAGTGSYRAGRSIPITASAERSRPVDPISEDAFVHVNRYTERLRLAHSTQLRAFNITAISRTTFASSASREPTAARPLSRREERKLG